MCAKILHLDEYVCVDVTYFVNKFFKSALCVINALYSIGDIDWALRQILPI